LRRQAQEAGAIIPVSAGSHYYRLVSVSKVPDAHRLPLNGNAA
jgi:hypothetical protein